MGLHSGWARAAKLQLVPGQVVLDVGCGPGGCAQHVSEAFDVHVYGLDLSVNMMLLALERSSGRSVRHKAAGAGGWDTHLGIAMHAASPDFQLLCSPEGDLLLWLLPAFLGAKEAGIK